MRDVVSLVITLGGFNMIMRRIALLAMMLIITTTAFATGSAEPTDSGAAPTLQVMTYPKGEIPDGVDVNDNMVIDLIREETGYDVEWVLMPTDATSERLTVMFASGDIADIVELDDKAEVARYGIQGVLAPLDDALAANGDFILNSIPDENWDAVRINGSIVAVPRPANYQSTNEGMMIRKDWLDMLGLDIPRTVEEFYEVLVAFKENDPAGGGNTVPAAGVAVDYGIQGLAAGFGVLVPWARRDGEIVAPWIEPEAREYLGFVRRLYEEELLNIDFPVLTSADPVDELFMSGNAGMSTVAWWSATWMLPAFNENVPDGEFVYIAPAIGPGGMSAMPAGTPTAQMLAVARSSENVDGAIDFLNKFAASQTAQYFITYGQEGIHHTVEDGVLVPTDAISEISYAANYVIWDTYENFMNRVRYRGFYPYFSALESHPTEANVYMYAPPIAAVDDVAAELEEIRHEYWVKIIAGAVPLEEGWQDFLAAWDAAGGNTALEALRVWDVSR